MDEELRQAIRRLDSSSRRALEAAARFALNHGFLGLEHLVWGLLQTPEFRQRIRMAGVEPDRFMAVIQQLLRFQFNIDRDPEGPLLYTPRLYSVLTEHAPRIARHRGHDLITPDDILIAILQQEAHPIVQGLVNHGIDLPRVIASLQYRRLPFQIPTALSAWCHDLTARAEQGELLPVIGREAEIEQMIRILSTPRGLGPANPLLIGEAGVGKTAIVGGLAQLIAAGKEPALQDVRIIQVDMSAMVSGTWLRGSFEERLKQTIDFAKSPPQGIRIVLFIDEVHLIIGAGRAMGAPADAAQMLLQPLGRGEIQIIGATTIEQYEEYVAQDEALSRRFSVIKVNEPSLEETRKILRGLRPALQERFRERGIEIRFTDEAIDTVLDLASQYLHSLRLPDKAIKWLREAGIRCARMRKEEVSPQDIVAVVSDATGISEDLIFRRPRFTTEQCIKVLKQRVKGQDEAIRELVYRVLLNLGPLREDTRKPIGVFLFVGPTGVGKTELAKALAELLLEDEKRIVRLDMSEYIGEWGVRRLIGPPRGVMGAGRGELTERIRHQPYTILLLDEFEKADPMVRALFLPVFDEGHLTDGLGRRVYFSDTIIILTSNLGAEIYRYMGAGFTPSGFRPPPSPEEVRKEIIRAVQRKLSPELFSRITAVCIFNPLSRENLKEIARLFFERLKELIHERLAKELLFTEEALECLADIGSDPHLGARALKRAFDDFIARELNPRLYEGNIFRVTAVDGKLQILVEEEAGMEGVGT